MRCNRFLSAGEGSVGVLVCGIDTGLCALSGTGSDVFYVRNGIEEDVIGGWGYLLSDDGSGVWIGQQALRHMMRVFERLEEPGCFMRFCARNTASKAARISTMLCITGRKRCFSDRLLLQSGEQGGREG